MSSKKNYVPRNPDEYDIFFKNIVQNVTAKRKGSKPEWDHIPKKDLEALTAIYADWYKAYEPAKSLEELTRQWRGRTAGAIWGSGA